MKAGRAPDRHPAALILQAAPSASAQLHCFPGGDEPAPSLAGFQVGLASGFVHLPATAAMRTLGRPGAWQAPALCACTCVPHLEAWLALARTTRLSLPQGVTVRPCPQCTRAPPGCCRQSLRCALGDEAHSHPLPARAHVSVCVRARAQTVAWVCCACRPGAGADRSLAWWWIRTQ